MPSRVSLPGASELFRSTDAPETPDGVASGRVRHEEKITVYVSSDELIALEDARLMLRKAGIVVDRGRIVRAALASALADLEDNGAQSGIVARLGS
ncbi:MAG: hypothetical protein LBN10_04055 [Propionibacteriaceae bacterium]|jgi:hypothetical protein|nr:hypothetical protein [Propionibacteriaceae bacterium]